MKQRIMKQRLHTSGSAALLAVAALFVLSCERISFQDLVGTEVNFSVSSSPRTKASYGSYVGTGSEPSLQNIEWSTSDRIRVYCAQCSGDKYANYQVSTVHPSGTASNSFAQISHLGTHGLLWGTGSHTFYAVHPDPSQISGASLNTSSAVCIINPDQRGTGTVTGTADKVVPPDMRYLWMSAKNTLTELPDDGDVVLNFKPLTTVLEFTVENGFEDTNSAMNITAISLKSDEFYIAGSFNVNMDQDGRYTGDNKRPKTSIPTGLNRADCDSVYINFGSAPVSVAYGKTLTFTFFLNPGNAYDVDDLTFEIRGKNAGNNATFIRSCRLEDKDGLGIEFSSHKKTRITGLLVPEGVTWGINGQIVVSPWLDGGTVALPVSTN